MVASVLDKGYEGGDFCEGLTVAYEGRHIATDAAMGFVKNLMQ